MSDTTKFILRIFGYPIIAIWIGTILTKILLATSLSWLISPIAFTLLILSFAGVLHAIISE